jgi:hypothetical protein
MCAVGVGRTKSSPGGDDKELDNMLDRIGKLEAAGPAEGGGGGSGGAGLDALFEGIGVSRLCQ